MPTGLFGCELSGVNPRPHPVFDRFALDAPRTHAQNHRFVATSPQHDQSSITQAIDRLAETIAHRHGRAARLLLLGIANGGIELTKRLSLRLQQRGLTLDQGIIDISFHRDDIGSHPIPKEFSPTLIPHEVNGATVILVDDVLHSGRTVKAALDELFDHGRPASVELAVLVDRGGRKLPIAATYTGITLTPGEREKVTVTLSPGGTGADALTVQPLPAKSKASLSK